MDIKQRLADLQRACSSVEFYPIREWDAGTVLVVATDALAEIERLEGHIAAQSVQLDLARAELTQARRDALAYKVPTGM
jgi:hypothetical protein